MEKYLISQQNIQNSQKIFKPQSPLQTFKIPTYKLIIIGDGGVGKTSFISRHATGSYSKHYNPTKGAETTPIELTTSSGAIKVILWDTAGQEKFGNLRETYYLGTDCAIIMFDLTARESYRNVPKWYKEIISICGKIPICLVGNKLDLKDDRKIKGNGVQFFKNRNMGYFEISAKSNENFEKPFEYLLSELKGEELCFKQAPIFRPPEIMMESQILGKRFNEDLGDEVLPDEGEDYCEDF